MGLFSRAGTSSHDDDPEAPTVQELLLAILNQLKEMNDRLPPISQVPVDNSLGEAALAETIMAKRRKPKDDDHPEDEE
jgi:hypothetical protein